jgi:uncharacterized protein
VRQHGLLDTGPLVAFINRADQFHPWAVEALDRFAAPLDTCDAVVAEAWHLLGRAKRGRDALLDLLRSGNLKVAFSLAQDGAAVFKLMAKYSDQPMSVADACLVRMAELDASATIVTLDSDFKVYRRGRAALRLAAPFSNGR